MEKFNINKDMFGTYCQIQTDNNKNLHWYKIINIIESNYYCDIPILWNSEPTNHKEVVPVLSVIHCGIDETKVIRVALSDCILSYSHKENPMVKPLISRLSPYNQGTEIIYKCPCCPTEFNFYGNREKYCHNCGVQINWFGLPEHVTKDVAKEYYSCEYLSDKNKIIARLNKIFGLEK